MLGALGLVGGLILSAVFATAGITKLADLAGTRTAVREFGAPRAFVAPLALLLPLTELVVAFILLPGPTRVPGAAGALVLLGIFSAAIAVSLARGRTPDCHCFGQLHSAPASPMTLARNALLAGLAALALAAGLAGESTSAIAWLGGLNGTQLAVLTLGCVVAALTAAVTLAFLSLLRSYGTALLRLDTIERRLAHAGIALEEGESPPELGLEPGTTAPAFEAADANGELVSMDDLLAPGLPLLLLFTSPSCGPCQALLPDIAVWQTKHADRVTIAVAHGGDRDTALAEAQAHDLERVLVDHDLSLQEAYGAGGTPTGVLVAPDGTIASWVAAGADWIERLVVEAVTRERDGLPLGSPAPELALVGLDGARVALVDPDRETLVVFWNPACGFCRSMHERLLTAERVADDRAPRLVIVSSGDEISTAAEGFISTVALDPEFAAGEAFSAGGTPMAVQLDTTGRVASPLAAGAEAVLALAHASGTSPSIDHVREGVAL